jgi:hypothetical protein
MRLRLLAAGLLVVPLALVGVRAFAQGSGCPGGSTSTACDGGDGNGGSGSQGGGGGQAPDDGGPDATPAPPTAPPAPPEQTAAPVVHVQSAPAPAPASGGSGASSDAAGGAPADAGAGTASGDQLQSWAQHFQTTPDEVKSWFVTYETNDTIGGEGSGLVVHPGDEMTVSNKGAIDDGAAAAGYMDMRAGNGVDISLHSARVPLATATTDDSGVFTSTVKIPSDTKLGRHFVIALSINTKNGKIAYVFPVNVAAPEPVFNAPAAPTSSQRSSAWPLVLELVAGTAMVAGLVVFRVRRSSSAREYLRP